MFLNMTDQIKWNLFNSMHYQTNKIRIYLSIYHVYV